MSLPTIAGFAKQYIALARTRGLTPRNPITFLFRPNANDQTDVYQVVVSMTEPSFSEKPYNLIWIDANSGSPQYQYVLLRTSHVSDGNHRGSWVPITDYAQLFKSKQIYRFVVENASDLGIEVGDTAVPHATTTRLGTVITKSAPQNVKDPVAVSSSDPRMSDARYPTAHDHPDYPRTMIRLNNSSYVEVASSNEPTSGFVLAIVAQDAANPNKFIGKWVKPTKDNVEWESPHLLKLRIILPGSASYMSDNSSVKLICDAEWDSGVVHSPEGVVWSIENNALGVTIAQDGTVTAPDLSADVVLKVLAKLRDPVYGNWVSTTYDLLIKNTYVAEDDIVSISIVGADSLYYKQKETYSVTARYISGNVATVQPTNFETANSAALSLVGLVATAQSVGTDTFVKLTATYVYKDKTLTAEKIVKINAQVMTKLLIQGAAAINSQASEPYVFVVSWSNGDTEQVTAKTFTATPSTYTTISGNIVTAKKETVQDHAVKLSATYTANGQTISGDLNITIIHEVEVPYVTALEIQGSNTIRSQESANYTFLATYSNGDKKTINPSVFTADRLDIVTIVNKTVNAGKVTADTPVTLSAEYTEAGKTVSATLKITIVNVVPVVDLTKIQIVGPTSVKEKTQTVYSVLATYSDGHTATVTPKEFRLSAASPYATFANSTLTVISVPVATSSASIYASYTENGITKNATLDVSIVGNPPTVASLEIRGADTMDENTQQTYVAWEILTDGTERKVSAPTWSVIQGSAFASISSVGVLSAGEVVQDSVVLIRATYDGRTASKSVTVKNIVILELTGVVPLAPSPVFNFNDAAATARDLHSTLNFSDGSTREGVSSELTYALDAASQEFFEIVAGGTTGWRIRTKKALSGYYGVKTFKISVTAVVKSVSKTGSVTFNVTGPTDEVKTVEIVGADSITEGAGAAEYYVRATRISGTTFEYTGTPSWSLPQGASYVTLSAGSTGPRIKAAVPANSLTQNQTCILRASNVTIEGKAYTPEKTISLINQEDTIVSKTLVGPTVVDYGSTGTYVLRLTMKSGITVDLTPVVTRSSGSTTAFTFNNNDTITANKVTTTQSTVILGTATYEGNIVTATASVANTAKESPVISIAITGPASVVAGTLNVQYTATATLEDGTLKDVTHDSVAGAWSLVVKSGSPTASISSGLLQAKASSTAGIVTIKIQYTQGSNIITGTKDVEITVNQSSDLGARFGSSTKIKSLSGFNKAFVQGLATVLTLTGEQKLTCPGGVSTSSNNTFFYVAWPKSLGYGYFVESAQGFAGSWDGAMEFDDFNFAGPAEVTIDGVPYVVYRNDFPFDNLDYVFKLTYGSSNPGSGIA